jgi:hypothetical protein
VAGRCEHSNEPSGSTKFLGQLNDCQLLKKACALWRYFNWTSVNMKNNNKFTFRIFHVDSKTDYLYK